MTDYRIDKISAYGTAAERAAFTPDPPPGVLVLFYEEDTGDVFLWDTDAGPAAWIAFPGGGGSGITELTGDVTAGPGSGAQAATIANLAVSTGKIAADAVTTAKILNNNVTLAKLATQADQTILGNNSGGAAVPSALTAAQARTVLGVGTVTTGTWTPGIAFGAAAVGVTYTTQVGRYTRVGNLVTASAYIKLSSKGSSTGNVTFTGLPLTTKNVTDFEQAATIALAFNTAVATAAFADPNTTVLRVVNQNGAPITNTSVQNASEFIFSITYECEP